MLKYLSFRRLFPKQILSVGSEIGRLPPQFGDAAKIATNIRFGALTPSMREHVHGINEFACLQEVCAAMMIAHEAMAYEQ